MLAFGRLCSARVGSLGSGIVGDQTHCNGGFQVVLGC